MTGPGKWPEEPGLRYLIHFLLRRESLCGGEEACSGVRPCICGDCGHTWETSSESPDGCPKCAGWKAVEVGRCYECPLTMLEEEMDSGRGRLIARVIGKINRMKAGITYRASDFTAEEAQILELVETERPLPQLNGMVPKHGS